jgi:Zn-dependent protease
MNPNIVYQIAVWLVPLVIAIVFHEVAHGLVARRLGDPTAEERGRLSFNPVRHVDLFGTLILPMMLAITHAPVFGWAKPVPVDFARLRHPRRDMVLVALAGPGMNLVLALIGAALLAATLALSGGAEDGAARFLADSAGTFVLINIFLGVFNLLPLPPFDGGHVVEGLLPPTLARQFHKLRPYSLLVLIVLLLVLPALSPRADIVRRIVSPVVERVAAVIVGIFGLSF